MDLMLVISILCAVTLWFALCKVVHRIRLAGFSPYFNMIKGFKASWSDAHLQPDRWTKEITLLRQLDGFGEKAKREVERHSLKPPARPSAHASLEKLTDNVSQYGGLLLTGYSAAVLDGLLRNAPFPGKINPSSASDFSLETANSSMSLDLDSQVLSSIEWDNGSFDNLDTTSELSLEDNFGGGVFSEELPTSFDASILDVSDVVDAGSGDALVVGAIGIPVITAVISVFKEGVLLYKGKTETVTAIKHVAIDVVSTGAGLAIGAFAGDVICTFFGLPGGVSLLLAAVGAITGKKGADKAKAAKLKQLQSEFERTHAMMHDELEGCLRTSSSSLYLESKRLSATCQGVVRLYPDANRDTEIKGFAESIIRGMHTDLKKIESDLDHIVEKMKSVFVDPWYLRIFGLGVRKQYLEQVDKAAEEQRIKLQSAHKQIDDLSKLPSLSIVVDTFSSCSGQGPSVASTLSHISRRIERVAQKCAGNIFNWFKKIAQTYNQSIHALKILYIREATIYKEKTASFIERLNSLHRKINIERGKLGYNPI